MNYPEYETQHIRLSLLRVLNEAGGYSCNEDVMRSALSALGFRMGFDALRGQLDWLSEQGLIALTRGEIWVSRVTARGGDVANGLSTAFGVARPRPGR